MSLIIRPEGGGLIVQLDGCGEDLAPYQVDSDEALVLAAACIAAQVVSEGIEIGLHSSLAEPLEGQVVQWVARDVDSREVIAFELSPEELNEMESAAAQVGRAVKPIFSGPHVAAFVPHP